jgi:hypothetical protein
LRSARGLNLAQAAFPGFQDQKLEWRYETP